MQNFVIPKYDGHIIRNLHIFLNILLRGKKRQGLLEENIKQICARQDALRVFIVLYQAILVIMLDIYEDKTWNSETITTANGLYNSMSNTQFIM